MERQWCDTKFYMALDPKPTGFLWSENKLKHLNIVFLLMAEMAMWVYVLSSSYYWLTGKRKIDTCLGGGCEGGNWTFNERHCRSGLLLRLSQKVTLSSSSQFFPSPFSLLLRDYFIDRKPEITFQLIAFGQGGYYYLFL